MKTHFLQFCLILLAVMTLSASAPIAFTVAPKEEPATIYIYRKAELMMASLNYTIFVNDEKICKLSNNRYLTHQIKPGIVIVTSKTAGKAELIKKKMEFELEVEAGGVYYIKCDVKWGLVRTRLELSEVTKNTAKRDLKGLGKDHCDQS